MTTMNDLSTIREAITHELKCHPEPFQAVKRGDKPFEWRKDDRDYRVGDTLWLREWDPDNIRTEIGSTASDGQLGARIGYAAALFHERSKPRTSLSVEDVMHEMTQELERVSHVQYDSHEICKHYSQKVRERLTAKLNELNTTDNG